MKVLLYYKYVALPDAEAEKLAHRELCERLNLKGRIILSQEGINGTCAGMPADIVAYKAYMNAHPQFAGIHFKESESVDQPFPKLSIKVRAELVTLRHDVDVKNAAPYITPEELHASLERGDALILVDMRNEYEAKIGRFKNAVIVPTRYFRELPTQVQNLLPYKDMPVVTYCTGGIRCEKASALLHEHGFTNVRQLEGGIVTYAEKYPNGFFEGTCFVFDDRMDLRYQTEKKILSQCTHCVEPCDRYIDCADVTCNALFLSCESCERATAAHCPTCQALRARRSELQPA